MSRKWSRMVGKNQKSLSVSRKKKGKDGITDQFKFIGRSWVLPSFLVMMLLLYLIMSVGEKGFMYWFTVIGYVLLSLFLFFIKRPFLIVGKDFVESRRFGGVFRISADEIAKITLNSDSLNISFNVKRPSWTFSKVFHLMKIDEMSQQLIEFAQKHNIEVVNKGK